MKKPGQTGFGTRTQLAAAGNWLAPSALRTGQSQGEPRVSSTNADASDVWYAYRLLLGREPDPAGAAAYAQLVSTQALSPERLAEYFLTSNEFNQKNNRSVVPVEVDLGEYVIFVRPIDHDISQPILETKRYEPHVTTVVRELLRPGDTFVDVGANIGYFTALAAKLVGTAGKVFAIEPMDKNVQLIYATIWRNGFGHVEVIPFAASDAPGLLPMTTGGGTSNGQAVRGGVGLPVLFAQAKRLDDLLEDLGALDLLKIDIEGLELPALRGFERGLARHRPNILTEFHPKCMRENAGVEPAEYLAFLFGYGDSIEVLRVDGTRVACAESDDVLSEWESADRQFDSHGTTHVDLFVRPRA